MLIVLDTNVLVSAMLKRISKPTQILDAVLEGKIKIVVNEQIFDEYSEVLHRPKTRNSIGKGECDPSFHFLFSRVGRNSARAV